MKRRLWLSFALCLGACHEPAPPEAVGEAPHADDEGAHATLPRQVQLDDAAAQRAGIETTTVKRGRLQATLTLIGEVVSRPDATARLSSPIAGRLESVRFNEGDPVKQGQVLATVRVPDVTRLHSAFATASARARAARSNVERLAALKAQGLGAEQPLLDAEADARAQEAEAAAIEQQLSAIGANPSAEGSLVALRAPRSGVVVGRHAVVGQPITPESVLGSIIDAAEVWFLARVFEKDLSRLEAGAAASVELNAWPGERFPGRVDFVSEQVDPVARTLTARIVLHNPEGRLRIGLFGRAHVALRSGPASEERLLLPRDAVVEVAGKEVVFVRAHDGDWVMHEVRLGESALDAVQVLSGVNEGEVVVSRGAFTLKSLVLKASLSEDD